MSGSTPPAASPSSSPPRPILISPIGSQAGSAVPALTSPPPPRRGRTSPDPNDPLPSAALLKFITDTVTASVTAALQDLSRTQSQPKSPSASTTTSPTRKDKSRVLPPGIGDATINGSSSSPTTSSPQAPQPGPSLTIGSPPAVTPKAAAPVAPAPASPSAADPSHRTPDASHRAADVPALSSKTIADAAKVVSDGVARRIKPDKSPPPAPDELIQAFKDARVTFEANIRNNSACLLSAFHTYISACKAFEPWLITALQRDNGVFMQPETYATAADVEQHVFGDFKAYHVNFGVPKVEKLEAWIHLAQGARSLADYINEADMRYASLLAVDKEGVYINRAMHYVVFRLGLRPELRLAYDAQGGKFDVDPEKDERGRVIPYEPLLQVRYKCHAVHTWLLNQERALASTIKNRTPGKEAAAASPPAASTPGPAPAASNFVTTKTYTWTPGRSTCLRCGTFKHTADKCRLVADKDMSAANKPLWEQELQSATGRKELKQNSAEEVSAIIQSFNHRSAPPKND